MIVPQSKFIFWVGVLLLPATILIAAGSVVSALFGGLVVVLLLAALLDAILALRNIRHITITLPQMVRFSKDRQGDIPIHIHNPNMKATKARLGMPFPDEIHVSNPDLSVRLPVESPASTVSWSCTPLKSGKYHIAAWYLEIVSPVGLWAVRTRGAAQTEIRVYPNLLSERKNLAALFLKKQFGMHTQRRIGKGHDFEQLRDYLPGDSYEDIFWKATARRGCPITKVFQIERTQRVYMIVDASRLSARSPQKISAVNPHGATQQSPFPETIMDRFITSTLVMGLAAETHGDLFGVLTFSDQVKTFLEAKNGKHHFNACRESVYTLQPQTVSPDFSEVFTVIGTKIRRRSLLVFLVNLDDPVLSENFIQNINWLTRKHLVLVAMVKPVAAKPVFSSPDVTSVQDLYQGLGGHFLWENLRETEMLLQRHGIGFTLLENEKMSAQLVSRYISIKQRQVL